MKVFITGGTGFIGKHLVRRMSKTAHTMYCLARESSSTRELRELGANIIIGDVMDRASLMRGMRGCDWVINLANIFSFWEKDKDILQRVNVEGTRNVMECALEARVLKVVHISTVAVYGKPRELPFREESAVGPVRFSEYGRTKYEGDLAAWQLHRDKHLPLIVVYPGGVLGSGDPKFTGDMIRRHLEHRLPATVFHDSVFTFVHADDVAEIILRAAEKPGNIGEKYFACGSSLTLGDFYSLVGEVSGVPLPRLRLPDSMAMLNARLLTWVADRINRPPLFGTSLDAMRTMKEGVYADGSKAGHDLGIVYTPVRIAVEEECAWHRESRAKAWSGEERRIDTRSAVDIPCDVKGLLNGEEASEKAHVADLSRQGMYITADTPLDEGTELDAKIMAVQFGNTFWVKGKVIRSTGKGMAVRFQGNLPQDMRGLLK
jgi:dihydroflavonol-4-reductase